MNIQDLPPATLLEVRGGDWFETTWGFMLGAAFGAGLLGSGAFLGVAIIAGGALVMDDFF